MCIRDRVLCLKFDHQLAAMPASDFINELLVNRLGIRYLVAVSYTHLDVYKRQIINRHRIVALQAQAVIGGQSVEIVEITEAALLSLIHI